MKRSFIRYLPLLLLAIAWEVIARLELVSSSALPPLSEVIVAGLDMVKDGQLEIAKDKRLSKPNLKGAIIGLFRRSAKGFGFVRPHHSTEKSDQIYIPIDASRDASSRNSCNGSIEVRLFGVMP